MASNKFKFIQTKKPFNQGCEALINKTKELAESPEIDSIDELFFALDTWNQDNIRSGISFKGRKSMVTRFQNEVLWIQKERSPDGPYFTVTLNTEEDERPGQEDTV